MMLPGAEGWIPASHHRTGKKNGRNRDGFTRQCGHHFNADKWEYPWYAAWDLAFHTIPIAHGGS